jgi:3'-phosphoadenosine 5'-phosphosulfate sulfotransferase (PAPS reductase)/FAD synthetase
MSFQEIIARASTEHDCSHRFVLFSGGNDSAALLHAVWHAGLADAAVHINTTIGIPQTREFVYDFCSRYSIPLLEYHPPVSYAAIVLEHGFPGPGGHLFMYTRLKERCIEALVREHKTSRRDRIMLITGVRLSESDRRMGHVVEVRRKGAQVWVAPFLDRTKDDLRAYREEHDVPESEVAALLHMSGECLCGAFAHAEEIKDIEAFYPDVARRIHALEEEVEAKGKHAVWGTRPPGRRSSGKRGELCASCK